MGLLYIIIGILAVLIGNFGVVAGILYLAHRWSDRRGRRLCWHCEAHRSSGHPSAQGLCGRCFRRFRSRERAPYLETFHYNGGGEA